MGFKDGSYGVYSELLTIVKDELGENIASTRRYKTTHFSQQKIIKPLENNTFAF